MRGRALTLLLVTAALLGGAAPGAQAQPSPQPTPVPAPSGHEASSGFAVVGRGFIAFTVVWVTRGLVDHPYYGQFVRADADREMHGRAAGRYTVILLEVANFSGVSVEGYLSVNVRLAVDGVLRRPVADAALAQAFPALLPDTGIEQVLPRTNLVKVYAFARVERQGPAVDVLVRPLWLFERRRQIGTLPEVELRFPGTGLTFPP